MVDNVVMKFDDEGVLQKSWVLPVSAIIGLRAVVDVTDGGWIIYEWPVTSEIQTIVQPWIDEPISVESNCWYIGSRSSTP